MTARWEQGLPGGVEPIPERIDHDLGAMRLAEALGVRPWELPAVPRRFVTAALISLEVRAIRAEQERAEAERARQRSKARGHR